MYVVLNTLALESVLMYFSELFFLLNEESGWKDHGELWTQIKLMEKQGIFGEHFTNWRSSFLKYQMHKRLLQG